MNGLIFSTELITPEIAKEYLKKSKPNRTIKQRVHLFADEMKRGNWQLNGEPICFDEDGYLINGQHRLHAVIESGCSVLVTICRNVSRDVNVYDRGTPRSISDILTMKGYQKDIANQNFVGMARLHFMVSSESRCPSDSMVLDFIIKYKDDMCKIIAITPNKKDKKNSHNRVSTRSAVFMLPLFYAYKSGIDIQVLSRFAECVSDGFIDGEHENAAVVCRNDIFNKAICFTGGSDVRKKAVFQIEKAIYDFAKKIPRRKTYSSINEPTFSTKTRIEALKK